VGSSSDAGEPDPHINPVLAMARRGSTGEKGLSQRTQAWRAHSRHNKLEGRESS